MTTWNKELDIARGNDLSPLVAKSPNEAAFEVEFYGGFGVAEGPAVLAWTEDNVYFPVVYDGAEWMDYAPRHPVADGLSHVGSQ